MAIALPSAALAAACRALASSERLSRCWWCWGTWCARDVIAMSFARERRSSRRFDAWRIFALGARVLTRRAAVGCAGTRAVSSFLDTSEC